MLIISAMKRCLNKDSDGNREDDNHEETGLAEEDPYDDADAGDAVIVAVLMTAIMKAPFSSP